MRCAKIENGKRSHLNARRGVEHVATTSDKINRKNDKNDSPQSRQEQAAFSHSTPVARKQSTNADKEESPDFDYSPNAILPLCTQEGGNEVAWDWQSSLSRTPENSSKRQNCVVHCETPKGTKLLQRKRNSNSPLLYKPLKRKTIKMENIENIGQFAAELQALTERMRVIKQNVRNYSSDCVEEKEMPKNTNGKEEALDIKDDKHIIACNSIEKHSNDNKHNRVGETSDHNNISKNGASGIYADLFDDSVDDDMIRCTQEIEERLLERGNSVQLEVKTEDSCTNNIPNKMSVQFSSSENSKGPVVKNVVGSNDNSKLKTYSKLSLKRDANTSIHSAEQGNKDPYKLLSNNNTIRSYAKKPCDNKKLLKSNSVDLFDFQDDSFDDWLATCDEDKRLFSDPGGSLTCRDESTKFQVNYKHLTDAPLKSEAKSADSLKPVAKPEIFNANYLQNRKFFKTKSLSEQRVSRNANTNAKGSHTNARASVSTKPIVTNDCKMENKAISLIHGMDRTRGSDVNRCAVKSDGNHLIKYHSTGNMKNDTHEMVKKTGSQPTARCTAEEIEKKRLQAVARLEARRKLHFMKITNNINR